MFPRMRNRMKDRDKVKSLFRRSMCKKDCGLVLTLILSAAFYFWDNLLVMCLLYMPKHSGNFG